MWSPASHEEKTPATHYQGMFKNLPSVLLKKSIFRAAFKTEVTKVIIGD